ncbi:CBS domain-containing protein [Flavisolibacter ginsenosidimutans]|uniref:CBS domain-containing protein n=1 Tax=Flavisolibacter ginsenosidimutans TaxID=661481 RepID=A0A5B8UDV4_9BACT|nr:CBS domain-containing protein [Flavisolibacter ginsenosidimutans]QEC54698.1 CBS domain-containing protein [Flavisolibacter ginsenosidimutans]
MEQVADLLAKKAPQFNTVTTDSLVSDALYQMSCEAVDFLIVLDKDKFKGIISDHDIASRILLEDRPLKEIEVWEFMNTSLPVATPDASLQSCMQLMERFSARHLAVFDRFEFKGVISSYDLMQEAMHSPQYFFEEEAPRRGYPWTY